MKVALASILAFRPSLIVLDEPFSGLDPLVRDELIEALLDSVASREPDSVASREPDPVAPQEATAPNAVTILLSSHDLAEIESFATHVAFLGDGRLLFAEEMPALSARFREVTLTLAEPTSPPTKLPASWLQLQHSGHTVRFVHTQADTEPLADQVRALYPSLPSHFHTLAFPPAVPFFRTLPPCLHPPHPVLW
jgi:ABC-2 type transport system ATP-binding protein